MVLFKLDKEGIRMKIKLTVFPVLLFVTAGCAAVTGGGKDYSSPPAALLGEWKMVDGSGEVVFSADGSYRFANPDGSRGRAEYRIREEDPEKRTIVTLIRLKEFNGEPVEEEVERKIEGRFSPNYQQFVGAVVDDEGLSTGTFRMER
jgi:hypothetical protein